MKSSDLDRLKSDISRSVALTQFVFQYSLSNSTCGNLNALEIRLARFDFPAADTPVT